MVPGGHADVLTHLVDWKIQVVGDLTQWSTQGRRTWIPGVRSMEGLPPGLVDQEPPQVGRILQVGQAWIAFDSKSAQATAQVRRTCQIVQLWPDGTIRFRKWTPMDPVTPFPLQQGTHMQAEVSRDGNSDLFSTSVDKLFGGADRIRFVSLSPPKLASIGGHMGLVSQVQWETRETVPVHLAPTPVCLTPRVHIGWDQWPEKIMCIATHTCATGDAWAHAVEQVPLGITGERIKSYVYEI